MRTKFYTPHILLQEFVNCIMIVHVEADLHNLGGTNRAGTWQLLKFMTQAAKTLVKSCGHRSRVKMKHFRKNSCLPSLKCPAIRR